MTGVVLAVLAFVLGALGAELVRRNAVRLGLVAAVTTRSSHSMPTPTGGGLGMVAGGTLALIPSAASDPRLVGVIGVALGIAALGLVDDRQGLSPAIRLPLQLLGLAIILLLALPDLGWWLVPATLAAGWWLNLYNFMDGIDGLAGSEAAFILAAAAALALAGDPSATANPLWWALVGTAAAALGFLARNWPPAKIFMGDAGSTWLGAVLVAFAALGASVPGWPSLWQWLILGAAFITDASVTLLVRALRGERIWRAHRSHAYQRLSRLWASHARVTLLYIAVDLFWLLPLAMLAGMQPQWAPAMAVLACAPLLVAALWVGAGRPDPVRSAPT